MADLYGIVMIFSKPGVGGGLYAMPWMSPVGKDDADRMRLHLDKMRPPGAIGCEVWPKDEWDQLAVLRALAGAL